MFDVLETIDRPDGLTIEIVHDDDAECPREDTNVSRLVMFSHGWCALANEADVDIDRDGRGNINWKRIARDLATDYGAVLLMPVWMVKHGRDDFTVTAGDPLIDSDAWDGVDGIAYCTVESFSECCGPWDALNAHANAIECIKQEVALYGQYLNGECFGYVIKDSDGTKLDSCWGFIGDMDFCIQEAQRAADELSKDLKGLEGALRALQAQLRRHPTG